MKKVSRTFTLSVYNDGMHLTKGKASNFDKQWDRMSFAESISPIHSMINAFQDIPLGSKVRVTMEVTKRKK